MQQCQAQPRATPQIARQLQRSLDRRCAETTLKLEQMHEGGAYDTGSRGLRLATRGLHAEHHGDDHQQDA